ncbi:MAG TPA: hypothetical protein VNU97_10310 [Rhizomicrobium sp.]|jgi:glutathione synthase/RimK-type ligase-like ATP-grasp enzyme|nr:hypothetical protein [Rhizomicrobium sp.]
MHFDVVVLGTLDDKHVSSVVDHLAARGVEAACVDQVALWRDTVTFEPASCRLRVGSRSVSGCSLVWNRRIYHPALDQMSVGDRKFARAEFGHALFGALMALTTRWFNAPEANRNAAYKAAQLRWAANDSRLRIPRSAITSNLAHLRAFIADRRTRYIVKALGRPMIENDEGFEPLHTTLIDARLARSLSDIRNAPCIVQEFIERQYEVRLNVIGDRVFATRMDTSRDAAIGSGAEADGRFMADYRDIVHTAIEAPAGIAAACTEMCAYFGLRFGAFDFAVDRNGDWIFFEVNPYGQWYWIEEMTGQALSEAMAHEICRQLGR